MAKFADIAKRRMRGKPVAAPASTASSAQAGGGMIAPMAETRKKRRRYGQRAGLTGRARRG